MPGWSDLPEETRWDLVAVVARFGERDGERTAPSLEHVVPLPPEPADDAASRERGRAIFVESCSKCHGEDAHGSTALTSPMEDILGRPLRARDLADPAGFRAGRAPADLYRRVAIGIPGVPMPSFTDLEGDAAWHLVHFLRSLKEETRR
jgi:mono/diheme cytochrome c family protein